MRSFTFLATSAAMFVVPASAQQAGDALSPKAYLEAALSEFETKHINRAKTDWPKLKAEARKRAAKAASPADTYPAIEYVIAALGEKHTLFYPARPPKHKAAPTTSPAPAPAPFRMPEPKGELIGGRVGYIGIPQFGAPADHPDFDLFVAMSRRILLNHDWEGVCGWIVDVRGNGGGNIWAMGDGLVPLLAPLVGKGPYMSFDIDGKVSPVVLKQGRLVGEGTPERLIFETRMAKNATAPIAVMIDKDTASSGEGVANLFEGLPNVRHFGETTADYVTVNNPSRLADGRHPDDGGLFT
jgi:carboxyl-terminal processing protease